MYGFVAVTNPDWFEFLRSAGDVREVNFWHPSGTPPVKRLGPGAPYFFKLKAPHNAIGGFGFFAGTTTDMPLWRAWEIFGEANGAPDLETMTALIGGSRHDEPSDLRSAKIACTVLTAPVFFPKALWVDVPASWSPHIQGGKGYDLSTGEGRRLWEACKERADRLAAEEANVGEDYAVARKYAERENPEKPETGSAVLRYPRLGQGAFRINVERAYDEACAVTREHSLPVLEAAHIKPHAEDGPSTVDNGLALRADLHKLFDTGYVTVSPDFEFQVSDKLFEDFENGLAYYEKEGRIWLPDDDALQPDREYLEWHRDNVFQS